MVSVEKYSASIQLMPSGLRYAKRSSTVEPSSRLTDAPSAHQKMGLMSSRMTRRVSIARRGHGRCMRLVNGRGTVMPASANSSAVPIMAVQSPA